MLITPKIVPGKTVRPYIEFPWEFGKIRVDFSRVEPEREIGGPDYRKPKAPLRGLPVLHVTAAGGDDRYYGGAFIVNRVNYSFAVHLIATTYNAEANGGPLGLAIPSGAYSELNGYVNTRRMGEDGRWLTFGERHVTPAASKRIDKGVADFIARIADPTPFPGTLTSPQDHLRELIRIGLTASLHETQTKALDAKHDLQALTLCTSEMITRCDNTDNRADTIVAVRGTAWKLAREVDSIVRRLPKAITAPR